MSLLQNITKMTLGLKSKTPNTFGVDPIPPGSLHLSYSTTGTPDVKWRTISGEGMKPKPSKLDDIKGKYTPKQSYINNKPKS
jgi:hypothetical protein